MTPTTVRTRAAALSALLVVVPALGALVCVHAGRTLLAQALAVPDPAGALLGLATWALAAVLAWGTAATAAGVVEAWRSGAAGGTRPRTTPLPRTRGSVVQAGVAALVVAALTAAPAGAASGPAGAPVVVEQPVDGSDTVAAPVGTVTDLASGATAPAPGSWGSLAPDGFRAPRGASAGAAALVTAQPVRAVAGGPAADVVVLAGDSLWSIAARHLGPGADDAEVAAAWPRWWEANRGLVGEDPHLLLPGQRLVVPAP